MQGHSCLLFYWQCVSSTDELRKDLWIPFLLYLYEIGLTQAVEIVSRNIGVGEDPFQKALPDISSSMNRNGNGLSGLRMNHSDMATRLTVLNPTLTFQEPNEFF